MDTTIESAFNVHSNDNNFVKFFKCGTGIYYFDTNKSNKSPFSSYISLSIVKFKNHILVDVELKEWMDILTQKGKLYGLL